MRSKNILRKMTSNKKYMKSKKKTEDILLEKKKINKIYKEIKKENLDFTFNCHILPSTLGKNIVKITSINGNNTSNLFFYKLLDGTKYSKYIKNIWFPCENKKCIPKKINKNIFSLFINKNNAIISKLLGDGFGCKT